MAIKKAVDRYAYSRASYDGPQKIQMIVDDYLVSLKVLLDYQTTLVTSLRPVCLLYYG